MTRSQPCKGAEVIDVHLGGVSRHGFCHPPDFRSCRAQEGIPQPGDAAQLRIVPGKAAHIVHPFVTDGVVAVHEVAIVPESIPVSLVHGFQVVVEVIFQQVLDLCAAVVRAVRKAPDAEGTARVQVLWRADERSVLGLLPGTPGDGSLAGIGTFGNEGESGRAGYAIGSGHPLLHVFVAGIEVVGHVIVVTEVHGACIRTPEVSGQVGDIVRGAVHLHRGRIALPEVFEAQAQSAADVAQEGIAVGTLASVRPHPLVVLMGTLLNTVALVVGLTEAIGVPLGPVAKQVLVLRVEE